MSRVTLGRLTHSASGLRDALSLNARFLSKWNATRGFRFRAPGETPWMHGRVPPDARLSPGYPATRGFRSRGIAHSGGSVFACRPKPPGCTEMGAKPRIGRHRSSEQETPRLPMRERSPKPFRPETAPGQKHRALLPRTPLSSRAANRRVAGRRIRRRLASGRPGTLGFACSASICAKPCPRWTPPWDSAGGSTNRRLGNR